MIEILSFKMVIDFFSTLALYGMYPTSIQVYYYDIETNSYRFYSFSSMEQLIGFYNNRFYPFDLCEGRKGIWMLNMFMVTSNLNNFEMTFHSYDIGTDNWTTRVGSQFDTDRNNVWKIEKERQEGLINKTIEEYKKYYNELYIIYIHGVYSPCYAVPPWTEYNVILHSYKNYFFKTDTHETQATRRRITIRNVQTT